MPTTTTIIGLEVHVQLLTQSKIFCGCSAAFNPTQPNVQTCPVCLGLPGSLPVMNRRAFELAVKTALALNCEIAPFTKWDRKQYYYPDLPKGYQISQYDLPFSDDGWLEIDVDEKGEKRRVGIIRAHLEEDAGKNMHDESGRGTDSQVDLNRCGTPLLEIVSQPDLRSPAEAKRYLEELRLLLTYLNVSDCNMQEGSLRCDANVNLHIHQDDGHKIATPIVEVKNLNSFRNVELALEYEVTRQYEEWQNTGRKLGDVPKETRGWDAARGATFSQRGKEEASDYRYFPDPDLVPVTVSDEFLEAIRASLSEFPADRRNRLMSAYGLSDYAARVTVDQGAAFVDYFEELARLCHDGKQACNWVTQDVLREMNERHLAIGQFPIRAAVLANLLDRIHKKQITTKSAREVFMELLVENPSRSPISSAHIDQIIAEKGLALVTDTGELDRAIAEVIGKNPKAVADFKSGKQAAVGSLIGQVMKAAKGADPQTVRTMLVEKLGE
ncbi:MAG TPA: Asp-tRNA(Asn)/Glu-tRNA(Gln) amidotransferase subunit GatB [Planctomycetaceae bacterium]|nr:Asp-tRNA(Asn)/Glu-tRNA(Gln) amidotransferase subunit GatB [Planctomycetaceae bacterium]